MIDIKGTVHHILTVYRWQQKPKTSGPGVQNETGADRDPIDIPPLRQPDRHIPDVPHQWLPSGPQPQFVHYPPHPQPSNFQRGMYPTQYPTGPMHAPYAAVPFQPLQPPSFPVAQSYYPPPSYAYGYPSHLPHQQAADPRFAMGGAMSHVERATHSPPGRVYYAEHRPRGILQQYPSHRSPQVQAKRVGT